MFKKFSAKNNLIHRAITDKSNGVLIGLVKAGFSVLEPNSEK